MSTITAVAGKPTLPGEVRWYPMAASQTFKKGEFVYLTAAGLLTVCAADPAGIAGMALCGAQDAAYFYAGITNPVPSGTSVTTTGIACPITLAKRGQQFTLHVTSGASTTTTANSQVGHHYSLYVASNIHYVDIADTSNQVFVVDALSPMDAVGDTTGRVIVEVCKGYAQLDQTTS